MPDERAEGRRNLSPDAFILLLGRRHLRVKKAHGGQEGNKCAEKRTDQIDPFVSTQPPTKPTSTAATLANQHGVSKNTVERVAIGRAVEEYLGDRRRFNADGGPRADGAIVQNFGQSKSSQRTDDIAAQKAGFGNPETYRQAKAVVANGTPELVEAMGGSLAGQDHLAGSSDDGGVSEGDGGWGINAPCRAGYWVLNFFLVGTMWVLEQKRPPREWP
ncbi:MAG: hypothetical protein H7838_07985 [Magnetococcus sp. DMHC-8]